MNIGHTAPQSYCDQEWFLSWFNSAHYQRLYAHRNDAEAADVINRLIDRLDLFAGATVLDLGCGTGRHSRHLASEGFRVLGLDLSIESIKQAKMSEASNLWFRRQDMRVPFGACIFDCVFNLFTSFGYFADPAEHLTVVQNISRSLKPGGCVVLDYLNAGYAEKRLVPLESVEREGIPYRISRWADADHIFKRIVVDAPDAYPREYIERVAKLTLEDFRFMFELCDMRIEATYGNYALMPFDEETSPRLIMVARKRESHAPPVLPAREVLADAADGFWGHSEVRREH